MTNPSTIVAISTDNAIGAAAHEFLSDLSMRDHEWIAAVITGDELNKEVSFWHEMSVMNANDYDDGVCPHEDVDPEAIAACVGAHVAGWRAAQIAQYPGMWS